MLPSLLLLLALTIQEPRITGPDAIGQAPQRAQPNAVYVLPESILSDFRALVSAFVRLVGLAETTKHEITVVLADEARPFSRTWWLAFGAGLITGLALATGAGTLAVAVRK